MYLKYKRLFENSPYLTQPELGNAGYDLRSLESVEIPQYEWTEISTGLAIEIPPGYVGLVRGRSGLAFKQTVFSFDGTIDENYRGEWKLYAIYEPRYEVPDLVYHVKAGDKIAQVVIVPYLSIPVLEVDTLSDTNRGENGFGSSGR